MKAKLIDLGTGGTPVRDIPLGGEDFLIGRGEDCDLCLYDPGVSRHHCLIRMRGQEATVSDLGSSNGTFVNGHRLVSQAQLKTGDELQLGPCRFVCDLGDEPDFQVPGSASGDQATTRMLKDLRRDNPEAFKSPPGPPPK